MSQELKSASQRVQSFLAGFGKTFTVKQMPNSTRTAADAADAIGCTVAQIAKSLIFKNASSGEPVLIVASGTNRVSTEKIAAATGIQLTKANADFVREKVGYAIGGVPPIAHKTQITTLLDPDLKQYNTIWAAAGTPNSVFELIPGDLDELTKGEWVELAAG